MDPLSLYRAIKDIEARNLEVVAIFHTHPVDNTFPSIKDLDGMRLWPIPWMIASPKREISAWILCSDKLFRLPIYISSPK